MLYKCKFNIFEHVLEFAAEVYVVCQDEHETQTGVALVRYTHLTRSVPPTPSLPVELNECVQWVLSGVLNVESFCFLLI